MTEQTKPASKRHPTDVIIDGVVERALQGDTSHQEAIEIWRSVTPPDLIVSVGSGSLTRIHRASISAEDKKIWADALVEHLSETAGAMFSSDDSQKRLFPKSSWETGWYQMVKSCAMVDRNAALSLWSMVPIDIHAQHRNPKKGVAWKVFEDMIKNDFCDMVAAMAPHMALEGAGFLAGKTAVVHNRLGSLSVLLRYIDPRWNKSELLVRAAASGRAAMVALLLPLSQPQKQKVALWKTAISSGWWSKSKTPEMVGAVLHLLAPVCPPDTVVFDLGSDKEMDIISPYLSEKTAEKLAPLRPHWPVLQALVTRKALEDTVAGVAQHSVKQRRL